LVGIADSDCLSLVGIADSDCLSLVGIADSDCLSLVGIADSDCFRLVGIADSDCFRLVGIADSDCFRLVGVVIADSLQLRCEFIIVEFIVDLDWLDCLFGAIVYWWKGCGGYFLNSENFDFSTFLCFKYKYFWIHIKFI